MAYGNNAFLAAGFSGTMIASPDGLAWTGRNSNSTNSLRSALYLNGTFVITGFRGTILTSTDGISWTNRSSGSTDALRGITCGTSNLVVVGHRGTILQSGTLPLPPTIVTPPLSQTVLAGSDVTFSVTMAGTPPFNYQWYFTNSILPGASGSGYTVTNAQPANAGNYTVTVTNTSGSGTSAVATLRVLVSPRLINPSRSGNTGSFSFMSVNGLTYSIEYKDILSAPGWTVLRSEMGSGGVISINDTNAIVGSRFYRVRVE